MENKNRNKQQPQKTRTPNHKEGVRSEQSNPIKNIGYYYYKEYYKDIDFSAIINKNEAKQKDNNKEIAKRNKKILDAALKFIESVYSNKEEGQPNFNKDFCSFSLTVAYPGLVTGTGLVHNSKGTEGGFNLGMHFDYTTGMPIVYGSSVKGVLRSYFTQQYNKKRKCYDLSDALLGGISQDQAFVAALFANIFEGKDDKGEPLSIGKRDIFFDAVITKPAEYTCQENDREKKFQRILEDDSITPHGNDPLKNPTPITMLKIAPGCEIEFRFRLHDFSCNGEKFTAEEKKNLFEKIIQLMGIGAKTNVGYGQLNKQN